MSDPQRPSCAQDALDRYYPEITYPPLRAQVRKVSALAEILQRHEKGESKQGDWFKAARLLLSMSRLELINLALDLGHRDEISFFPVLLKLVPRTASHFDRAREKILKKAYRDDRRAEEQENTVARVALLQSDTVATLEEACEVLSEGEAFGKEKVRQDYLNAVSNARKRGYALLQSPNHMVPPVQVKIGLKSPKGRRPQKG